ncbi:MAG TPA: hypothetical protein VNA24_20410 [Hyalangium sp.]|nr:hypothetical protein [Hyalangium sp.]
MKIGSNSPVAKPQPAPSPQAAPAPAPKPAPAQAPKPQMPANEPFTSRRDELRRQAATLIQSDTATTLRTERLGDGNQNCLERAVALSGPRDQILLLDDSRDNSGHALIQHPDGSVTDPNFPQIRYESLGQWQAMNPSYTLVASAPAASVRSALKAPVGPERDAALAAAGLQRVADIPVADEGPQWVTIADSTRIRSSDDITATVTTTRGEVPAEIIGPVEGDTLAELQKIAEGDWYEVRLATGETGYVIADRTTELTEFTADTSFGDLSTELGAPLEPSHLDEDGNLVQTFTEGQLTLRSDGVRVITPNEGEPVEVPPEWGTLSANAMLLDEDGATIQGSQQLGEVPVQIIRQVPDDQDFDSVARGDWFEVRLPDGRSAYVFNDRLSPPVADRRLGDDLIPAELGAPLGPMLPAEGGGFAQKYENGEVRIDDSGNVSVLNAAGEEVASRPSSLATSVADANAHHVTQRGAREAAGVNEEDVPIDGAGNPVGNPYNDGSEWFDYNDCGPTSVVIAASLVGAIDHPDAAHAGEEIDRVRDLIFDTDTTKSVTTGVEQLAEGIQDVGANAIVHTTASLDAVDAALDAGNPVILGGDPMDAWGKGDPNYLEAGNDGFLHWVVVSGRTPPPEENYIINDPLSPTGAREVTREELEAYLNPGMGMVEVMP